MTSGGFGPTVNAPVAMGYVATGHHAAGTPVALEVRGKMLPAKVAAMPFVPAPLRQVIKPQAQRASR